MSEIQDYIAMAVAKDESSGTSHQVSKRQNKRFNLFLWPLLIILILAEGEHYKLAHELAPDEHHLSNIDQLYDEAEKQLTQRYQAGESLLAPFENPILAASIGVLPQGNNKITLFYRGDHTQAPGRELIFSES
ncbi:hypothetical protein [Neptuniibacter halophilus]|uniref:hypothetical protein n=1 Tax=Neptuniibacter halophilus TaxID=651666 RepID=UPI00257377E7|nr:hypothetical protein [Neptuniibacter halophilus]